MIMSSWIMLVLSGWPLVSWHYFPGCCGIWWPWNSLGVNVFAHVRHGIMPAAESLRLGATALVLHRNILAGSLATQQSSAPLLRSWRDRELGLDGEMERKVTIWQEDRPDLDLLWKRTGINIMRMSKQLLRISLLKRCNVSAMQVEMLSCKEETTHNTHTCICEHHCNEYM